MRRCNQDDKQKRKALNKLLKDYEEFEKAMKKAAMRLFKIVFFTGVCIVCMLYFSVFMGVVAMQLLPF